MSDNDYFDRLTGPFRRELLAHCRRILGSVDDTEKQVQETYQRAWRRHEDFDSLPSLRTWLYRIAVGSCPTVLSPRRDRRLQPAGLGGSTQDTDYWEAMSLSGFPSGSLPGSPSSSLPGSLPSATSPQAAPGDLFGHDPADPADPAAIALSRQTMRLALVAAFEHLPARQCVVLILRDVLQWRVAEIAALLGSTTGSVDSTLRRARTRLEQIAPAADETTAEIAAADGPARSALLDQYVAAVEGADTKALTALLTENAAWEMPPLPIWLVGRETVGRFVKARCVAHPGDNLLVPVPAAQRPVFGGYLRDEEGVYRARTLKVLTLAGGGISRIVTYQDPELFALFDLPPALPAVAMPTSPR
jgi:RNA polymerase sigma-70 factor (ECF subfamily)